VKKKATGSTELQQKKMLRNYIGKNGTQLQEEENSGKGVDFKRVRKMIGCRYNSLISSLMSPQVGKIVSARE